MHSAVGYGVLVWGAYAVAEVAFLVVWPLANNYQKMMLPIHWKFLAVTIGVYLAAGAVLGWLAGWAGRRLGGESGPAMRRLAVLTLVTAYLANLAAEASRWNSESTVALALGVAALVGTVAGLIWPRLDLASRPWSDPWRSPCYWWPGR
jgi:NhaP-type Na+/H+ or K+/H+ antiporter